MLILINTRKKINGESAYDSIFNVLQDAGFVVGATEVRGAQLRVLRDALQSYSDGGLVSEDENELLEELINDVSEKAPR